MGFLQVSLVTFCAAISVVSAIPSIRATTVGLDDGIFIGTTSNASTKFLGIPFAHPPVDDLRFRLPKELGPYNGTYNASTFGPACPQQVTQPEFPEELPQDVVQLLKKAFTPAMPNGEDCLTLNVVAPVDAGPGANLPVVVWIFGGGFEYGSPDGYDGGVIVERSIALGEPVVYVSMNYRLSAFGFLASQEVEDAGVGNLGLNDQRLALRWIQKYIGAFGGDPSKVTIWGESAGAISVALHMLANDGNAEGLFRAAFMQSGAPTPVGNITHGQPYYDDLVERCGCSGSSDTLACLRMVPYAILKDAVDSSPSISGYQSLALSWQPRADGVFLSDRPQQLVLEGKVADVPFVVGNCDDEGTLFSLSQLNITTTEQLHEYVATYFLPHASSEEIDELLALYPEDVTQGSPYDTGTQYAITPQYKRIAALLGDFVFQAPRRFFLQQRSGKQNTWFYLSNRLKQLPIPITPTMLGSLHGSDLLEIYEFPGIYGPAGLLDYLIHFATNLDPNGGSSPLWPQYTNASPQVLTLLWSGTSITQDTYRAEGFERATNLSLAYPF